MLISIIIPAYNVEDYIEECIHSAFAQTHKPIEVICIDNNSTDNTWQKLKQLQETYPSLLIEKELKPGAPAARNKGLVLSKGEWIQFLDADDLLLPEKIEHQVHLIKNKPEVCFIAAASRKKHINGQSTISTPKQDHPFKSLFTTNLGNTCSNLWNKTYINQVNGWDESLKSSQEADLMFRLLQVNEKIIFDGEPLTIIRERAEGQISQRGELQRLTTYFETRWAMYRWIKEFHPEIFTDNNAFFASKLFQIVQKIGLHDINAANAIYLKYKLRQINFKVNFPYKLTLTIGGFIITEKIRQSILKLHKS